MTALEEVLDAYNVLPPAWRKHAYVAGGAAARPTHREQFSDETGDIDIWLVGKQFHEIPFEKLCETLDNIATPEGDHIYEFMQVSTTYTEPEGAVTFRSLAKMQYLGSVVGARSIEDEGAFFTSNISNRKIDICLSDHYNVTDMLRNFDLSVHQWALDQAGNYYSCETSTELTEPIRVLGYTTPARTFERAQRLCARYNIRVESRDWKWLKTQHLVRQALEA